MIKLKFGTYYNKLRELNHKLNDIIQEAELLKNDPELYISDYFDKIINKADIAKEEQIQIIQNEHYRIVDDLKAAKKECLSNATNKSSKMNEYLESSKLKTKDLKTYLKIP